MIIATSILLSMILAPTIVKANPDPVAVSWLVLDSSGNPIDGAWLTIYYSTSTSGPFTPVPADTVHIYVEDRIPSPYIRRNPVISGYFNPDHDEGVAFADVHVPAVENYCFYVEINYDSMQWYWPIATSKKPGDPSWDPVMATGSPSGYAASGNGIGNGPTTAYKTRPPPDKIIPEVPLGPIFASIAMIGAFGAYFGVRKRKLQL
jgi:hypothetical protein